MPQPAQTQSADGRHAFPGRGDRVHPAFWMAAGAMLLAAMLGAPLGRSAAVTAATIVFVGGGLPHGAYDVALLRRAVVLGGQGMALAVGGYATVAVAMALLWMAAPLVALVLFLAVAAVHFGEDWQMLDEPLLRVAAGAAIIAAPAIGHPADVAALFAAMSDDRGATVARLVTAAAPVALLVTAVGVAVAWQDGSRAWAAAMTLCLILLIVMPPVAGFALFFVFLHSPRHLARTRTLLRDMSGGRWLATGAVLSIAAIAGWYAVRSLDPSRAAGDFTAQAFQLLAAVAVPHLLLSRWLERHMDRTARVQHARAEAGTGPS